MTVKEAVKLLRYFELDSARLGGKLAKRLYWQNYDLSIMSMRLGETIYIEHYRVGLGEALYYRLAADWGRRRYR